MSERREQVLKYFKEHEDYMNDRVSSGIELYRKDYAKLLFVDKNGNPVNNVKFKASLKKHDFKFGCNMFLLDEFESEEKNAAYRKIYKDVFNYAVAPFYWDALEPEKGKPRYSKDSPKFYRRPAPDLVLEYCRENDIDVKGHCIVYDAFAPSWLPKDDVKAIKREYEKHFASLAERYGDKINDWDVINESLSWDIYSASVRLTQFFCEKDYVEASFEMANRHFPFQRLFINEASSIWENFRYNRSPYYMQLKLLEQKNVPFDAIGLQMHMFVDRQREFESALRRYNPKLIYEVLDTYGEFQKPMQISEITIPSYNGDEEDMELQAELLTNLYKIWFSHKNMDGIVYWNLVDGYTWAGNGIGQGDMNAGENRFGGALLYHDMGEKPAFKALKKLVKEEWHTEISSETGETNTAAFKGFKGLYDISYIVNGREHKTEIYLGGSRFPYTIIAE